MCIQSRSVRDSVHTALQTKVYRVRSSILNRLGRKNQDGNKEKDNINGKPAQYCVDIFFHPFRILSHVCDDDDMLCCCVVVVVVGRPVCDSMHTAQHILHIPIRCNIVHMSLLPVSDVDRHLSVRPIALAHQNKFQSHLNINR